MPQRPTLAIIGPGVVGTAIARVACRVGYRIIALAGGSNPDRSRELAHAVGGATVCGTAEAAAAGQLVLLTVKDAAIELLCRQLASAGALNGRQTVAHCSGALPADVLDPARQAGCAVGSIHPLQTFPDVESAIARIPGTHWFIEGDPAARSPLEDLARAMGGYPQTLSAGKKTLYHAAAVFSANYLTTLLDIALELYGRAGIERDQARQAMAPIVRATVENALEHGSELPRTRWEDRFGDVTLFFALTNRPDVPFRRLLRGASGRRARCGGFRIRSHALLEFLFHESADLELHGPFRRDVDALEGLGVLRGPRGATFGLEDAEVAELQPVAPAEFFDDLIEERLDDLLDHDALLVRLVGDAIDQLFLGYCMHEKALSRVSGLSCLPKRLTL